MTGELDNNNTPNSGGLSDSMLAMLEELSKEREQKKAEEEKEKQRNATYDALKKNEAYSVLKDGGIDEMIQKNRAILDSQAALELAIQNAKQNIEMKKMQTSQQVQGQPKENPFNPANPTGSNAPADDKTPLTSQQFMDKMVAGQATLQDLERVPKGHLNPFVRYQAKKAILNKRGNTEETIAKGRAALGVEE